MGKKRSMKTVSLMVCSVMLISIWLAVIPSSAYAAVSPDQTSVSVVFGSVAVENGIHAWGLDKAPQAVTKDGKEAWNLEATQALYAIAFNVDDTFINGGANTVDVNVEYFDEGTTGKFTLTCDATFIEAESVALTGTNTWKTHTFHLKNVQFNNGIWGNHDFRVQVYGAKPSNWSSGSNIYLGSVTVSKVPKVAAVSANPAAGTVLAGTSVVLSSATVSAAVYYTTDGSDPTVSVTNKLYTAPITVGSTMTVKAYAAKDGMADSDVGTFQYLVGEQAAAVTANPAPGTVPAGTTVNLSSSSVSASVYYTMDGSDPRSSQSKQLFTTPIPVNYSSVIKAYAVKDGWNDSDVSTFNYQVPSGGYKVGAVLGTNPSFNGLYVVGADLGIQPPTVTVGGKQAWHIYGDGNKGSYGLFGVVDSGFLNGTQSAYITIEYFDGPMGKFALQYDAVGTGNDWKEAESVQLTGTNTWKTYTYLLEDAELNRGEWGNYDFKIATWAPKMGSGGYDIDFASIIVSKPISADLGIIPTTSGLGVSGADLGVVPPTVTVGGRQAWHLYQDANKGSYGVFGDVADDYIRGGANSVEIDVNYFDTGTGKFAMLYDSVNDPWKETEAVQLTGTNTWKTYTFTLADAKFDNSEWGHDFKIATWTPIMGGGGSDIDLGKIVVRKAQPRTPLTLDAAGAKVGNIFAASEQISFNLILKNNTTSDKQVSIQYSVSDMQGKIVLSGSLSGITVGSRLQAIQPLQIPVNDLGTFTIQTLASDGTDSAQKTISFSRVQPSAQTDERFGVGTHFMFGVYDKDKLIPLAQQAGFGMIRDEMSWNAAETVKGTIQVKPEWDAYIDAEIAHGIKPLLVLDFSNPNYDNGGVPVSDEAVQAFAKYAAALAEHFKGKIEYFEVWNEYNLLGHPAFNPTSEPPEHYAKLIKAVYPAIKAVNPDAKVIGGVMYTPDLAWLERVFQAGAFDSMDIVSSHFYTFSNQYSPEEVGMVRKFQDMQDLIKKYGASKPIWITETGFPTSTDSITGVSEERQAAWLVRDYATGLGSSVVQRIFTYDMQNDGLDKSNAEHTAGLIRNFADPEAAYAAKPSYVAMNALTHKIGGFDAVKDYSPSAQLHMYKFHRPSDNQDVIVMWNVGGSTTVGLKLGSGQVLKSDMFGNSITLTATNGVFTVSAGEDPIYLEGSFSNVETTTPLFQPTGLINASPGTSFPIDIVRSGGAVSLEGQYQVTVPVGWTMDSNTGFSAGVPSTRLTFSVPASAEKKTYEIELTPVSGSAVLGSIKVPVHVIDPVDVVMVPVPLSPGDWSKWALSVQITNKGMNIPISGSAHITGPTGLDINGGTMTFSGMGQNLSQTFVVPVQKPTDKDAIDVIIEVNLDSGITQTFKRRTSFLAAMKTGQAPVIDGKVSPSEWSDAMPVYLNNGGQYKKISQDWKGTDDLSAQAYFKWDDTHLYAAVNVKDDIHNQTYHGADVWQGDSIQLALDPGRMGGAGSIGYHEMGFGLNNDGKVDKWRWTTISGKSTGVMTTSDVQIIRDESSRTTTYELAIPWSELLPDGMKPTDQTLLGLSLLLNDDDGTGRHGYMEYMSGIGSGKNPGLYGDLTLASNPSIPATGVSLDKTTAIVNLGDTTTTFVATVAPANATDKTVKWSSSDNSVATVDANGVVTAKAVGTATITVTTADGKFSATSTVTVVVRATGVTLDHQTFNLRVKRAVALHAIVTPANATNKSVTWSSSNNSVATVDANGVVTAKAVGQATITVTTADGNFTATSIVTVSRNGKGNDDGNDKGNDNGNGNGNGNGNDSRNRGG